MDGRLHAYVNEHPFPFSCRDAGAEFELGDEVVARHVGKTCKSQLKQSASQAEVCLLGRDREDVKELRVMMWEKRLKEEATRLGVNLDHLPSKKSAPEKVRLAALLKANTSVSNGWLAKRLHMGEPATVSQYVRRFRLASEDVK